MITYRSKDTIQAVQFTGDAIPDITCGGSPAEVQANGCDSSRKQHLHVHTQAIGGMTVLQPSDWIFAVPGGPWGTASDGKFRAHWEVPAATTKPTIAELETTFAVLSPTTCAEAHGSLAAGPAPEVATETAAFPEADTTAPVDVAVVPATQSVPVIGADGSVVAIHHIETFPDGSTNITETPVEPAPIPVPAPHTIEKPETAVGEGLVTEAPTNPAIFTD